MWLHFQGCHPEVVEGNRRVMRKQGAELVQAGEDHKGAAMMLGRQSHHMSAYRSHDATIGQHYMGTNQHLHSTPCMASSFSQIAVTSKPNTTIMTDGNCCLKAVHIKAHRTVMETVLSAGDSASAAMTLMNRLSKKAKCWSECCSTVCTMLLF